MGDGYTRRELLLGGGSLLAAAGFAGVPRCPSPDYVEADDPRLVDGETDTVYPLVTYNDHGGPFEPTMPVNLRFDLTGSALGEADVEAVLDGNPEWTRLLADLDEQLPIGSIDRPVVWDGSGHLALPARSYRILLSVTGPTVGYHVHMWPVRVDGDLVGVAASAHTDVGNVIEHIGARFGEAADRVAAPYLAAGWEATPATFAYGVDDDQRSHWGPTGDRWLRPPPA